MGLASPNTAEGDPAMSNVAQKTKTAKNAATTTGKPRVHAVEPLERDAQVSPLPVSTAVPKPVKARKASGLDAAAQVLKDARQPMRCRDIVRIMLDKGMWTSDGKTPHATIYAAMLREIQTKGKKARFKKTDRGLFTSNV
jgi:hypothetical protein